MDGGLIGDVSDVKEEAAMVGNQLACVGNVNNPAKQPQAADIDKREEEMRNRINIGDLTTLVPPVIRRPLAAKMAVGVESRQKLKDIGISRF
jgi:hypothetical protein